MKEMTDRELSDKISQVFDNFEDPHAAHGWKELRKKYPENNTRTLIWLGAAAAVLMVVSGLWFLLPLMPEDAKKLADHKPVASVEKAIRNNENRKPTLKENITSHETNMGGLIIRYKPIKKNGAEIKINIPNSPNRDSFISNANEVRIATLSLQANETELTLQSFNEPVFAISESNSIGVVRDSLIDLTAIMLALAPVHSETNNHRHKVEVTPHVSKKTNKKNNSISFYAGSYLNYSLGSDSKLNFGAGFSSDFKLASNLRLSTGLALANNTLSYRDGVPASTNDKRTFDVLPFFGVGTTANNNPTTVTRYDASLLALDIPVNLKYLIIPRDNKLYLIAGLSSGTYLNETYSLDYQSFSASGMVINQAQGIEVRRKLRRFDLARTLNLSFGYSSNLWKIQNITIEPFLKYPLSGLGTEDLKFGSAGVNLRLNFSQFKR